MERLWAPWRMEYILAPSKEGCVFCDALKKGEDGFVLFSERLAFIIMNTYPYNNGHIMVAPTRHTEDLNSLTTDEMLSLSKLVKKGVGVLKERLKAESFNIGMNLGKVAGAGEEHLHIHIVPRWTGDSNFMPVISDTKVVSQGLIQTYRILKEGFCEMGITSQQGE